MKQYFYNNSIYKNEPIYNNNPDYNSKRNEWKFYSSNLKSKVITIEKLYLQ